MGGVHSKTSSKSESHHEPSDVSSPSPPPSAPPSPAESAAGSPVASPIPVSTPSIELLSRLFPGKKRSVLELVLRRCQDDLRQAIDHFVPLAAAAAAHPQRSEMPNTLPVCQQVTFLKTIKNLKKNPRALLKCDKLVKWILETCGIRETKAYCLSIVRLARLKLATFLESSRSARSQRLAEGLGERIPRRNACCLNYFKTLKYLIRDLKNHVIWKNNFSWL